VRDLFGGPIKIGIIGSRRRDSNADFELVLKAFQRVYEPGDSAVSGGCKKGADRFAEIIAKGRLCEGDHNIPLTLHLPDKSKLDPHTLAVAPRAAYAKINYDRNTLVARDSDVLIACVAEDRKGGTEDTIRKWKRFHPHGELILV
jgi:hypothetical protein